jgi:hypothetical protein
MVRLQQALVVVTQGDCRSVCGFPYPFKVAAVVQARLRGETSIRVPYKADPAELCTVLHGLTGRKPEAFMEDLGPGLDGLWLLRWP